MSVHSGETTKDGKKWYFTCYYKDYKGIKTLLTLNLKLSF